MFFYEIRNFLLDLSVLKLYEAVRSPVSWSSSFEFMGCFMSNLNISKSDFRSGKMGHAGSEVLPYGGIPDGASEVQTENMIIIDPRVLDRECLSSLLRSHNPKFHVSAFGSRDEWLASPESAREVSAVVLSIGGTETSDPVTAGTIKRAVNDFYPVPIVVLGDSEDLDHILRAFECGARGYIPSSVRMAVCVGIIQLTIAGGLFIPADPVLTMNRSRDFGDLRSDLTLMFTPRETEIVMALRCGKANKIIAYELRMQVGTVKVHIRKIMQKLNASNRTEVAYRINSLFSSGNYS